MDLVAQEDKKRKDKSMNIIEAAKSRKWFSRKTWNRWMIYRPSIRKDEMPSFEDSCGDTIFEIYVEDLLADDYEVKEDNFSQEVVERVF